MPHVQAGFLCRRECVPYGRDLRIGEHDARRAHAVDGDPFVAAGDVVGGQARVVLAHVRERSAAVHVPDRVEPRMVRNLERRIGVDVLARRRARPCRGRVPVGGLRPTTTSSSSPSAVSPPESDTTTRPFSRATRSAFASIRRSTPASTIAAATCGRRRAPRARARSRPLRAPRPCCRASTTPARARLRRHRRRAPPASPAPTSTWCPRGWSKRPPRRSRRSAGSPPGCRRRARRPPGLERPRRPPRPVARPRAARGPGRARSPASRATAADSSRLDRGRPRRAGAGPRRPRGRSPTTPAPASPRAPAPAAAAVPSRACTRRRSTRRRPDAARRSRPSSRGGRRAVPRPLRRPGRRR